MIYCLYRLRHNTVIRRNDKDCYISYCGASGTHLSKCSVSRSIKECYLLVVDLNLIRTYMLGYSARLAGNNTCIAYSVKQRRFAVVDMAHNDNNWVTRLKIRLCVYCIVNKPILNSKYNLALYLYTEFLTDKVCSIKINILRRRRHNAHTHKLGNNLSDINLHSMGQLTDGNLIRHQNFKLRLFTLLFNSFESFRFALTRLFPAVSVVLVVVLLDYLLFRLRRGSFTRLM